MCYHTSAPSTAQLVKEFKNLSVHYQNDEIYHINGFLRPRLPVTLNTAQDDIIGARWTIAKDGTHTDKDYNKLPPFHLNSTDYNIFRIHSKQILHQRGLLYVTGFFEPHDIDPGKPTKDKRPSENYFIYQPDHKIFTLGIIWNPFENHDTGETYPTFSIITTNANPLLYGIHNIERPRMPLIIPENSQDAWLNATDKNQIQSLIKPYDGELGSHRTYRVTGARGEDTNIPSIQDAI